MTPGTPAKQANPRLSPLTARAMPVKELVKLTAIIKRIPWTDDFKKAPIGFPVRTIAAKIISPPTTNTEAEIAKPTPPHFPPLRPCASQRVGR